MKFALLLHLAIDSLEQNTKYLQAKHIQVKSVSHGNTSNISYQGKIRNYAQERSVFKQQRLNTQVMYLHYY